MEHFFTQNLKRQILSRNILPRIPSAWLVGIITLLATALIGFVVQTMERQQTRKNIFEFRVEKIKNAIAHRMQAYQHMLESGTALFTISPSVDRQAWREYVTHLRLDKYYPGIQGVGFSQVIYSQEKIDHVAKIRAEGGMFLNYTLKPEGERELYTSIVYLEPLDVRNQQAIGYDMFSEPVRRAAMEQARDTGEPVLSGKVRLVQEIDQNVQAGCLMYVPVYRHGQPHDTVAEKRLALIGYVYSPFRMHDLMQGIFYENKEQEMDFHIYDGKNTDVHQLMYEEVNDRFNRSPRFTKVEHLTLANHLWTLYFATLPNFDLATKTYTVEIVWLTGLVISLLLFGVTRLLETDRLLVAQQQMNILLQKEILERMQVDQALQESQKQLRLITDHVPAFIAYVDTQQIYRFVNKRYEEWFGLPREHIIGKSVQQILGERTYGQVKGFIQTTLSGQSSLFETLLTHQDGSQHCLHTEHFPNIDSNGTFQGYFVLAVDITERKQAEETIRRQHTQLLTILESTENPICLWDQEKRAICYNTAFSKIIQRLLHLKTHVGLRTFDYLSQDAQTFWKPILNRVLSGERYRGEFGLTFEDGEKRDYEICYYPVYHDAEVIGYSEYTRDITEHKQIEGKLRLHKEIVENMSEGVALIRVSDGRIVYTNQIFEQMLGYTVGELLDSSVERINILKREHPIKFVQTMMQQLDDFGVWQGDMQNLKKDGTALWCHVNVSTFEHPQYGQVWIAVCQDVTDRKQAEERLRESEEKYRSLLEHAGLGIAYYDLTGRIILFNQRAAENMKGRPKDFVGKYVSESFREDVAQFVMERIDMTVHSEDPLEFEDRIELPGGTFWFFTVFTKMQNGAGEVVGVQTISQNITERKQAEEELQEVRSFAEQVIETANVMAIGLNSQGQVIFYNSTAEYILGYTYAEVKEQNWFELIVPRDRYPQVWETFNCLNQNEEIFTFENPILTKGGEERFISWRNSILRKKGQIMGTFSFGIDITERKRMEELLRASEYLLSHAVRITHLGTFEWNFLDNSSKWSDELFQIFGVSRTISPSTELFFHLVHPEDYDKVTHAFQAALAGAGPYEIEYRIMLSDGELRYVQSQGEVQWNESGQARSLIGTVLDITERKQMEFTLQSAKEVADAANRAKSIFLANMSHELRTPLNGILGYAQLLSGQDSLTQEQKEGIEVIKQSGEHLLVLINDVLDLAKIEAGKIELFPTVVFLDELMQEIVQLFQMRAQQKNLSFSYQTLSKLPIALHADEKYLRQVLINLLGNAIKFTEHGDVTLGMSYELGTLYVQIEDTGIGIAPCDLERIFLPFQQVGDQKSKQQGTGLGLSVTKNLVEIMGGHVQVSSTLGQGSTFWVSLPLPEVVDVLPSHHDTSLQKIIGYQGPRRTVLVIDDHDLNRSLLNKMLTPLGFIVLEAQTGQLGLKQALENESIDVIFIDLVMPEMNGFTVIQQLRQISHHRETILITVSASAFESDRQRSIALGSNDFIPKPINLAFLLERLGIHLKLTWCYEQISEDILAWTSRDSFPQTVPSFALTPSQAAELFHLAICGDVMGLSDYIKQLEKADEQLVKFSRYILKLLESFDMNEIAKLVEPFLEQK